MLRQLTQLLTQTANSLRSQRNLYGTQIPHVLLLHIFGFFPSPDLRRICKSWWLSLNSPIAKDLSTIYCRSLHLRPLYIHQELDALDSLGMWHPARITALHPPRVHIHHLHWSSHFDNWLDINSPNLALLGSKCGYPRIPSKNRVNTQSIVPGTELWYWDVHSKRFLRCQVEKVKKIKESGMQRILVVVDSQTRTFKKDWLSINSRLLCSENLKGPIDVIFEPWNGR